MDHHPVPHIDTAVGNAGCVIGALKKDQIAGAGRAGGGADVIEPLGPQAAHIPAGVIDHPGYEAGAVKGSGGGAAAPHIGITQVLFRLAQDSRKGFIVQIFLRHIVVGGRFRVFVHIPGLREQVGPVAQAGHIEGIPGQLLLAHKLQGEMGKVFVFQRHIADIPVIRDFHLIIVALAVCAGFRPVAHLHHHILGENVLAVKEHFQGALYLGKRPFPLVEHREDGDEHIGIVFDPVQVKMVFVIVVGAFVGVQVVLQLRLHIHIGGLSTQDVLIL